MAGRHSNRGSYNGVVSIKDRPWCRQPPCSPGLHAPLQVLDRHGIPYGFTFCSVLINPVLHHIAYYVPPFFYPVSLHNTTFIDRLIIFTTSWTWSLLRRGAAILRVRLPVPELNYDTFVGRLVMVNSIPGLDYPQPLPPLVQYTGPLVDVQKHQAFPPEVAFRLPPNPLPPPTLDLFSRAKI